MLQQGQVLERPLVQEQEMQLALVQELVPGLESQLTLVQELV